MEQHLCEASHNISQEECVAEDAAKQVARHKRCHEEITNDITVIQSKRPKNTKRQNAERQRKYIERLMTPEKEKQLQEFKERHNARQRERRQLKKLLIQAN